MENTNKSFSKKASHHIKVSPDKVLCENKYKIIRLLKELSSKYNLDTADVAFVLSETLLIMSNRNE